MPLALCLTPYTYPEWILTGRYLYGIISPRSHIQSHKEAKTDPGFESNSTTQSWFSYSALVPKGFGERMCTEITKKSLLG